MSFATSLGQQQIIDGIDHESVEYFPGFFGWQPTLVTVVNCVFDVQPEQSADFTATAGTKGICREWPVDISGLAAGSLINVAAPIGVIGDRFAVFDSRLATDNGVDGAAMNRRIQINFTDNLHSLPGPDFAEINSSGSRVEFLYVNADVGWRIEVSNDQTGSGSGTAGSIPSNSGWSEPTNFTESKSYDAVSATLEETKNTLATVVSAIRTTGIFTN